MKRKALLIGINYERTANKLSGCINDVINIKKFLTSKGYTDFVILTDDTTEKPTRINILKAIFELVTSDAQRMFLHYSGHGSNVADTNSDEQDKRDECLVPLDFNENGMITDDQVRGLLCLVPSTSRLTAIIDACHSGTCFDLAYNMYERAGKFSMIKDYGCIETDGQVIMFSGCLDEQTSADAYEEGKSQGAMTYGFIKACETAVSYNDLMKQIRKILSKKYTQIPTLSSGKSLLLTSTIAF